MNLPPPIHHSSPSPPSSPDEMAIAMGFSSFGNQSAVHAAKRKKYTHNPEDDGEYSATGGNMLPLGVPRKRQGEVVKEGQGANVMEERGEEGGSGGHNRRGAEESMDAETSILLQRQAELLQRINATPSTSSSSSHPPLSLPTHHASSSFNTNFDPNSEAISATARQQINDINNTNPGRRELPKLEAKDGFEGHTWNEWRKGVTNERGDIAFYDASFVENPWRGAKG
ncbi:MAG: hypothetical protein Q9169_003039 [Polycauliona sp. 2 TL-2023]